MTTVTTTTKHLFLFSYVPDNSFIGPDIRNLIFLAESEDEAKREILNYLNDKFEEEVPDGLYKPYSTFEELVEGEEFEYWSIEEITESVNSCGFYYSEK